MKKDPRSCMHFLEELCNDTQRQAELLYQTSMINGQRALIETKKTSDKLLEESDEKKLLLIRQLSKAFVTPIDREDILMSALLIHKLSFMLNEIFTQTVSLGLTSFGEVFVHTSQLLIESCKIISSISNKLSLPYSDTVTEEYISQMSSIKQKGQKLHFECVKKLFSDIRSPYSLVVRQSVYERIKECCNFSYDICDYLVCVIIKNT
ncbi:MAG: DUF47 family protein [Clostridia bacterium]|nr:DUF47 family protein [Clostridia bacterium]